MILPGRLGPRWLSSGNPPLWVGMTWLCLLGWSRDGLLPLTAPVKGDGINILRREFVHGWETSSHKIGHILLRLSLPLLKCMKKSGRHNMCKCHLSWYAHVCSFYSLASEGCEGLKLFGQTLLLRDMKLPITRAPRITRLSLGWL